MNYKALYRTYRPSSFTDVVGQQHIVATLQNAVSQNKIAHAYLFCGPRGTGKTSIAKLLAKAVNCKDSAQAPCGSCESCLSIQEGNHPDIIEIDAASNNGVDEIRSLIEKVKYSPIEGRYKVYIIDEVHMLSTGAFNALLKTLEEPPEHILFILATTEPHKILPTIVSRCQRYDFTRVENSEIVKRIELILTQEKISCEKEAIQLIAELSEGGVRDALSILDQCIAYAQNNITCVHVNEIYGITTVSEKLEVLQWIFNHDVKSVLSKVKAWTDQGIDIRRLTSDLIDILKEAIIFEYTKDSSLLIRLSVEQAKFVIEQVSSEKILELIQILMETSEKYRTAINVISYFEVALLKMIHIVGDNKVKTNEVVEREEIENTIVSDEVSDISDQEENETELLQSLKEPKQAELLIQEVIADKVENQDFVLDEDSILGLMVQGSKAEKFEDIEKWKAIESKCRDISSARYANVLKDTKVVVSNDLFLLLSTPYQALVNEICESKQELESFIRNDLLIDKVIYVITKDRFDEMTKKFIERKNNNSLPQPLLIQRKVSIQKEEEKDPNMSIMIDLFGDDFTVIEEESK